MSDVYELRRLRHLQHLPVGPTRRPVSGGIIRRQPRAVAESDTEPKLAPLGLRTTPAPKMGQHFLREQLHTRGNLARIGARQRRYHDEMSKPREALVILDHLNGIIRRSNYERFAEEACGIGVAQFADRGQAGNALVARKIVRLRIYRLARTPDMLLPLVL